MLEHRFANYTVLRMSEVIAVSVPTFAADSGTTLHFCDVVIKFARRLRQFVPWLTSCPFDFKSWGSCTISRCFPNGQPRAPMIILAMMPFGANGAWLSQIPPLKKISSLIYHFTGQPWVWVPFLGMIPMNVKGSGWRAQNSAKRNSLPHTESRSSETGSTISI